MTLGTVIFVWVGSSVLLLSALVALHEIKVALGKRRPQEARRAR